MIESKQTKTASLKRGRVLVTHRNEYIVEAKNQKINLEVSGRFKYMALEKNDYPVVGDYVLFHYTDEESGIIESIEKRTSILQRLGVSNIQESQILAANIDVVFVCMSLNEDFNITKLNNLMSLTYSNNFKTIILLTKSDLCDDVQKYIDEVGHYHEEEVQIISAFNKAHIVELAAVIGTKTAVFLGSSGVGKSTIINSLIGEEYLETNDIRLSDAQGRHTTVHRELIKLESGGAVIDTPGIRLINSYYIEDIDSHFEEIIEFAKECKFRDCTHTMEPGCTVQIAIDEGDITIDRFEQYLKAQRLNNFILRRESVRAKLQDKKSKRNRKS